MEVIINWEIMTLWVPAVLVSLAVLHLLGLTGWLSKSLVAWAATPLPAPLRARLVEECQAEIDCLRNPLAKLYVGASSGLDALRLKRLWRQQQLRRVAVGQEAAQLPDRATQLKRVAEPAQEPQPALPPAPSAEPATPPETLAPQPRLANYLGNFLRLLFTPAGYRARHDATQHIKMGFCSGKHWRLKGGTWVNE